MSGQSGEKPGLNRVKESTVMEYRKIFFLKMLKEAKQVTEPEVTPQERCRLYQKRMVMRDVPKDVLARLEKWKVAEPDTEVTWYALRERGFFDVRVRKKEDNRKSFTVLQVVDPGRNVRSPFRKGYDYYVQCQNHEELKEEFRKHLPSLRNLFVDALFIHAFCKRHDQFMIDAHFEDDIIPEATDTLAASFLAAFFTILEDKSSTIGHSPMK